MNFVDGVLAVFNPERNASQVWQDIEGHINTAGDVPPEECITLREASELLYRITQAMSLSRVVSLGRFLKDNYTSEPDLMKMTARNPHLHALQGYADGLRTKIDSGTSPERAISGDVLDIALWLATVLVSKHSGAASNLLVVCGKVLDIDVVRKRWTDLRREKCPHSLLLSRGLSDRENFDQVYGDHLAYQEYLDRRPPETPTEAEMALREALRSLTDMSDGNAVKKCRTLFYVLVVQHDGDMAQAIEVVEEEKGPDALPDFVPNYTPAAKKAE